MADIAELLILINAQDNATKKLTGVGSKFKEFGKKAAKVGLIGVAALAGIGAGAIKMAADFDAGMREVSTLVDISEDQFQELSKQVRTLSQDLGVDAVESTAALYQAISAGIPAENALEFLQVATKAAIGGVTDTETAVDGLTSVMNAFKIPMSEAQAVADTMFTTVKGGKTTFEELSASMFNVAPLAASAGVAFETVSAALATMTKQGVPTSVATTQLRAAIQAIIKPTADMKKVIEEVGFASGQAMIEELGFAGTLDVLSGAAAGNTEQLGKMFGSIEGMSAVLALTGDNATTFAADIEAVANSAGSSMDAYNEINKGAARQFAILQERVKGLIGALGAKLLPILTPVIDSFLTLIEALPLDEIGELIAELLPPLIKIFADLIKVLPIKQIVQLVSLALKPMLEILKLIFVVLEPIIKLLSFLMDIVNKILGPITKLFSGVIGNIASFIGGGIKSLFGGAEGGLITKPTLLMAGENGPEMLTPLGRAPGVFGLGAGGGSPGMITTITNHISVDVGTLVGSEEELVERVRQGLIDIGNSNVNTGLV